MEPQRPSGEAAPCEGAVPIVGSALYYRDIGQGPPIIVLHDGPGFDHNYLLPDMDRLSDTFRLIYYGQRGRGKSAGHVESEAVSIQSEIADLEALRAYLHLEQAALLGHSWGGLLAMEYALRHPERVSHLILFTSAPASYEDCNFFIQACDAMAPDDTALLRVLESCPELEEGDLEARAAYYRVYFRRTLRPPKLLDRLVEHLQASWTKDDVLRARAIDDRIWNETYESTEYKLLPQLARLRVPTLILHGDYDCIPAACSAHIAVAILGARLVVLRDCGHFAYLERPDEVRPALSTFFQLSSTF